MTLRDLIAEYETARNALDAIAGSTEVSDDRLESLGARADVLFEQIVGFKVTSPSDGHRKFLFIGDYLAASAESALERRLLGCLKDLVSRDLVRLV